MGWLLFLLLGLPLLAQAAVDLSVEFDPASNGLYIPGTNHPVTIIFRNTGDVQATGAELTLGLAPASNLSITRGTCTATGTDSDCGDAGTGGNASGMTLRTNATIAPNGSLTISATVNFQSGASGDRTATAKGTSSEDSTGATTTRIFEQAKPQLALAFDPTPDAAYVPGQSYPVTLVFENTGTAPANGAKLTLGLPAAANATITSGTCVPTGADTLCGSQGSGGTLYQNATIAENGKLTINANVSFATSATGSGTATATGTATNASPNASATHTFIRTPYTDLEATVVAAATATSDLTPGTLGCPVGLASSSTYTPGCPAIYTVTVKNNGPDPAPGATVGLERVEAATGFTVESCSATLGASCPALASWPATITTFPSNAQLSFKVKVVHQLSDDFPVSPGVGVEASVNVPAGQVDWDAGNDTARSTPSRTRNPSANLKATVTPVTGSAVGNCPASETKYTPGCSSGWTVVLENTGPDTADDSTFSIARTELPAGEFNWNCVASAGMSCPDGTEGTGALSDVAIDSFPENGSLTYTVTVAHPSGQLDAQAGLSASVTPPASGPNQRVDIDTSNNQSSGTRSIDRRAEIKVLKEAVQDEEPITETYANVAFDYLITVSNLGPSDIGNALDQSGNTIVDATGPALVLEDQLDSTLDGVSIAGMCSTSGSGGKPCWAFCRSSLSPQLGIDVVTYEDCELADQVDGTEANSLINERFALRAGTASRLLTRVKRAAVSTNTLIENTADVSISSCPAGEPSCKAITVLGLEEQRTSEANVTIRRSAFANLQLGNLGGVNDATPGLGHAYVIKVSNQAFSNLPNTQVQAAFPLAQGSTTEGFIPGTVYYQCKAQAPASCATSSGQPDGQTEPTPPVYANSLATEANLPAGGSVEYTVHGLVDPRAGSDAAPGTPDVMSLSATVVWGGPGDSATASIDTPLVPEASLTLTKFLRDREERPDGTFHLTYDIVAGNNGPSFTEGVVVLDNDIINNSSGMDFSSATWTCQAQAAPPPQIAPAATRCSLLSGSGGIGGSGTPLSVDLMPGGRAMVRLEVNTDASAGNVITNNARLEHPVGDVSASDTRALRAQYTLAVDKTDGMTVANPGAAHSYAVTVSNKGPDDAFGVRVHDVMPLELQNVSWTCAATSPVPGDLEVLEETVTPQSQPGEALVMTQGGHHVYVIGRGPAPDNTPTIFAYQRQATPGLDYGQVIATPIDVEAEGEDDTSDTGSAVEGMADPVDLALSLDEAVLYVLSGDGRIAVFHRVDGRLNPDFGQLSFAGFATTAMLAPRRIGVTGAYLYVVGSTTGGAEAQIEVFRPNPTNQLPEPVAGGVIAAPDNAGTMVVDAARGKVFVASSSSSRVRRYGIADSGPGAGLLVAEGDTDAGEAGYEKITDLVLAPNGRDLYLRAGNSGAAATRIGHVVSDATGLAFVANYEAPDQDFLGGVARLAISPDGEHLVGVNRTANRLFKIRRNVVTGGLDVTDPLVATNPLPVRIEQWLSLTGEPGSSPAAGLDQPAAVLVTPDNRHVLVASASISGGIGPLTVFSRRAPAPQLGFIEMDREGDAIAGTQDFIDTLTAPADVATRGRFVYVLSKVDSAITLFERSVSSLDPDSENGGHLKFRAAWRNGQGGVEGMTYPDRLLISPNGESLFVTSVDGSSLAVFARDPAQGTLSFARSFKVADAPALSGAFGMAMDPGSAHLYVAGSYGSRIAIFSHNSSAPQRLSYVGQVVSGQGGVTGLDGIRDLVVAGEGSNSQVIGVADAARTVVVFNRSNSGSAAGQLSFVQSLVLDANARPMALAVSPNVNGSGNAHIYVAAQNTNAVYILQRIQADSSDPQYGRVRLIGSVGADSGGSPGMLGARDVAVSGDGKRVYVTGEFGHGLVALDRFDNASSAMYGQLALAEVRTQDVDAVDGISAPYAVAVSEDSRNVYVTGFDSNAVASFSVGTGSFCSASGTGDIDDIVNIRAGGAVMYTVDATIRPDASGTLSNTVRVEDDNQHDESATDTTELEVSARLRLSKTNNQVAVVPGTEVTYDIVISNEGVSNVTGVGDPARANVSDLLGCVPDGVGGFDCSNSPFDIETLSWTCDATGSGSLEFGAAYAEGNAGIVGLGGVSSLGLIPGDPEATQPDAVRANFLVAASVDDNALVFFKRHPETGALSYFAPARVEDGVQVPLQGARSVAVTPDGKRLFVASRQSDSLNVFGLSGTAQVDEELIVTPLAKVQDPNIPGLDKALHVIVLPATAADVEHAYVAGANDHAIAGFRFNRSTGVLGHVDSWVNNLGGVDGLADVEYLVASPDGAQVYALSGSGGSVTQFDRDADTGELTHVANFSGAILGVDLDGVSSGAFDASGKYLYLTASTANRLVVLKRVNDSSAGSFGNLSLHDSLAQEDAVPGLVNPRRLTLSSDGQHLYVTSQAGSTIAWFSLHPETGKPAYQGIRANQSGGVTGLAGATGLVLDPVRNQLYVAGTQDHAIVQFQRTSDSWCPASGNGLLDQVPVNIAAHGQVHFRLTVRVGSELVGNLVNHAQVDWLSANDWTSGPGDDSTVCTRSGSSGPWSCSHGDQDEDVPSNLADLSITKDDGLAEFDGMAGASAIAADARNVYVAGADDNAIGMFRREPGATTGAGLRYLGVVRSGEAGVSGLTGVSDLVLAPDDRHLYAVSPTDNAISVFTRNATDGRLSFVEKHQNGILGVTGMGGAGALVLSPDGAHVYVTGRFNDSIAIFQRETQAGDPDFGRLEFKGSIQNGVGGVIGLSAPHAVVMSPDGKQLYVLSGTGALTAFVRQTNSGSENFGRLTRIATYQNGSAGVLGMDQVRSLALSGDGEHLYVLGAEAGSLVHFERDPGNGELTFVPVAGSGGSLLLPGLVDATRMRVAEDGHLYVASRPRNAVMVFALDAADGVPSWELDIEQGAPSTNPGGATVDGLIGASDIAFVDDTQPRLYVGAAGGTGPNDAALTVFSWSGGEPGYEGSLFDGMGGVAPGDAVTYVIEVTNHGPSDVAEARVVDTFPEQFEQVSWTCSVLTSGADCNSGGTGNLNEIVVLPSGGRVQFEARGIVRDQAAGRLVNTATVEAIGVLDLVMSNNSATDDDTTLAARMDLSISVDDDLCDDAVPPACTEVSQATPGGTVSYRVIAANAGPSYARDARVTDVLPAALHDVSWTCEASPQAGLLNEAQVLLPSFDTAYRAVTVDPQGRYAYAVGSREDLNGERDTLVVFSRDPLNGLLTRDQSLSEPPAPGEPQVQGIAGAVDVVTSLDGRFVYVAGQVADAIAVFERDPTSNRLVWRSRVVDSEQGVDGIGGVQTLVMSGDGRHLYAAGASSKAIAGFSINPGSGALTQVSVVRQGGGVNGLNGVSDLVFDESGEILFVTATQNRSVSAWRRNASSGALSFVALVEEGDPGVGMDASLQSPGAIAVGDGRVFVADAVGDAVNLMRFIDDETPEFRLDGVLALDAGVSQRPVALAYVADQARLYVAASASSQLHLYDLLGDSPRLLASYGETESVSLRNVADFVLAPGMRELHAVSGGTNDAAPTTINTMTREYGSRCPLAGVGGLDEQRVDLAPGGAVRFDVTARIFANATGNLVYAASIDPRVLAQEIDPIDNHASDSDLLVPSTDLETRKTRLTPDAEVVAGRPVAYQVEVENRGISDALGAALIDDLPLFPTQAGGLLAGSGEWLCAANAPIAQGVHWPASEHSLLDDLVALVASADGRRWFAVSTARGDLVEVRLDAANELEDIQVLVDAGAVPELQGVTNLALSPDEKYLYVTSSTVDLQRDGDDLSPQERQGNSPFATYTGNLIVFEVDASGVQHRQTLVSGVAGVAGLRGARLATPSADGRFVYVAAVPGDIRLSSIALFEREAETGTLRFIERIQDGLGTFEPAKTVINDLTHMYPSRDGRHLYTLAKGPSSPAAPNQQTLARFDVNPASGKLTYISVLRAVDVGSADPVLPQLMGARALVVTPGETQMYVLGAQGVLQFSRAINGSLGFDAAWPVVNPAAARQLAIDTWGSRLYVVDEDGTVHLHARQWSDGSLEHRFSQPPSSPGEPRAFLHVQALGELVLLQQGDEGGATRLPEQAISRCLVTQGGNEDLPIDVDMGVSGWARMDYAGIVHPSARGTLRNVARAEPAAGGVDPEPGNDEDHDEVPILVESDLSIRKSGPEAAVAGEYIEYEIRVDNAGPSNALGIHVKDDLDPTRFLDASWTCAIEGPGDSACASPAGSGITLDAEADLHVGDTLVITLKVMVHPAFLGELSNAAYVVPEPDSSDPTTSDHEATPVETTVVRRADLEVVKRTESAEVVAGMPVAYAVTVRNIGPSDAPDVRVLDILPSGLREITWTCSVDVSTPLAVPTCGDASGLGSIDQRVSLPVGTSLNWQIEARLAPSAEGMLVNTASAALLDDAAGDVSDPEPDNNSATVSDPILQKADLALAVTAPDAFDPDSDFAMPFRIDVHNHGPSNAGPAQVTVDFSHPVRQTNPDCAPQQGTHFSCTLDALALGAAASFELGLRELPAVPAILTANLSVASVTDDPESANDEASISIEMRTGVDLEVSIDDGIESLSPGDSTRYTIRVRNLGSVDAVQARVLAQIAGELLNATWQCTAPAGAACGGSGSGDVDDLIDLPAGASLTYTLDATLDADVDSLVQDWYEQGVEVETDQTDPSQTEVSTQNNSATDRNRIYKLIFRDGFEGDPPVPRPAELSLGARWLPPAMPGPISMPDAALPSPRQRASVHRFARDAGGRA